MREQAKIQVIPKEEAERRRDIEQRAEIGMLKVLLRRYFPEKMRLVFPEKKNLVDNFR